MLPLSLVGYPFTRPCRCLEVVSIFRTEPQSLQRQRGETNDERHRSSADCNGSAGRRCAGRSAGGARACVTAGGGSRADRGRRGRVAGGRVRVEGVRVDLVGANGAGLVRVGQEAVGARGGDGAAGDIDAVEVAGIAGAGDRERQAGVRVDNAVLGAGGVAGGRGGLVAGRVVHVHRRAVPVVRNAVARGADTVGAENDNRSRERVAGAVGTVGDRASPLVGGIVASEEIQVSGVSRRGRSAEADLGSRHQVQEHTRRLGRPQWRRERSRRWRRLMRTSW